MEDTLGQARPDRLANCTYLAGTIGALILIFADLGIFIAIFCAKIFLIERVLPK